MSAGDTVLTVLTARRSGHFWAPTPHLITGQAQHRSGLLMHISQFPVPQMVIVIAIDIKVALSISC